MVKGLPAEEFLVSFLVDARGGYMQAQRLPQLKIFVPPDAAPYPTRIICHLLKPDRLKSLPELNDCDGFASRIIQVHSSCPKFQKPIIIEVPHIASLRNGEREIVILRKNYDSESWKEHNYSVTQDNLKDAFGEFYNSLTPENELESSRIRRIVTTDIPNYFCLVSRFQRNSCHIGQDGGSIESSVDNRIKIKFPPNALMKKIQISLEVQAMDPSVLTNILGDQHQVSISPIVTVEPKRRKFRDLIDIQMPLPKGVNSSDLSSLRILFSISEFETNWEDVTNSTELLKQDDCVIHSTKISARVWLISAPGFEDVSELANKIYSQHCCIPYIGRFLAYARRHDIEECQLRLLLITDDNADKTLECQESFDLIATGPEVEIISKLEYQIETAGNLVPVTKSDETIHFLVQPFLENRLTIPVRMRNHEEMFSGKVAFIPEVKSVFKKLIRPVTTLDILIPDVIVDMIGSLRKPTKKTRVKNATLERIKGSQAIAKTELNLQVVAEKVGGDWPHLATELGLDIADINLVLGESCIDVDKAFMTLIQWQNLFGNKATGNELNRALRTIGREDVVKTCMGDIIIVDDEQEVLSAKERLRNDVGSFHDESWDEVMRPKNGSQRYSESVNESMIAETGDDWSERNKDESKESEVDSDDKSLVEEGRNSLVEEPEVQVVINSNKKPDENYLSSEDRTAAYLTLIGDLDNMLPEPLMWTEEVDNYGAEPVQESIIFSQPLMSCMPSRPDFEDHEEIFMSIKSDANLENSPNILMDYNDEDNSDDTEEEVIKPKHADLHMIEEQNSLRQGYAVAGEEKEYLNPQQPLMSYEVTKSEPNSETKVEEETEVLPDGTTLTRKIIKKQVSQTITEKTIREVTPEEVEQLRAMSSNDPVEVIETEHELEDGTIVKRTLTTTKRTILSTSENVSEHDHEHGQPEGASVLTESTEISNPKDDSKPLPKSRNKKSRKNKSKSSKM